MRCAFLVVLLLGSCPLPAGAQNAKEPEPVQLTIHPMSAGQPVLKDRFLPGLADQTPGNAATVYLMAFGMTAEVPLDERRMDELLDASMAELNVEQARKFVEPYHTAISQLELAGRRTCCDWDPTLRENGFDALLPYLNRARQLANVLSIEAKPDIKERHYEKALRAIQTGFQLSHNVSHDPVLVQALVALGIQEVMLNRVRDLIQQPGAPNLYWPLAVLPSLADQRQRVVQNERAMLYFQYPGLKHPEQLSAADARQIVQTLDRFPGGHPPEHQIQIVLGMIRDYPQARKFLSDRGLPAAQVEAMPANSVVLAYDLAEYERWADEIEKWAGLPLWQAYRGINREVQSIQRDQAALSNPFLSIFPGYYRDWMLQFPLIERQRAMLQIVEALRAYAAGHQGALANSLDDLSPDMPAPLDPVCGKPFEYGPKDGLATLRAPAPEGERASLETIYRITVAR